MTKKFNKLYYLSLSIIIFSISQCIMWNEYCYKIATFYLTEFLLSSIPLKICEVFCCLILSGVFSYIIYSFFRSIKYAFSKNK